MPSCIDSVNMTLTLCKCAKTRFQIRIKIHWAAVPFEPSNPVEQTSDIPVSPQTVTGTPSPRHPPSCVYGCWCCKGGCKRHLSLSRVHCWTGCCVKDCSLCLFVVSLIWTTENQQVKWLIFIYFIAIVLGTIVVATTTVTYLLWCENCWVLLVLPQIEPRVMRSLLWYNGPGTGCPQRVEHVHVHMR